jgi:hypothetical protein
MMETESQTLFRNEVRAEMKMHEEAYLRTCTVEDSEITETDLQGC